MNSIKSQYKSETKNIIIKTASKLLFSKGFSNVSTNLIAKSANIAKGTLFHHFRSKEDLIFEVIIQFFMKSYDTLLELRKTCSAKEILRILTIEALKTEEHAPGFLSAIIDIIIRFPPDKVEYLKMKGFVPFINFFETLMKELGVKDSLAMAHIFIAILDGIAMQLLLYKKTDNTMTDPNEKVMDVKEISDTILDIILK